MAHDDKTVTAPADSKPPQFKAHVYVTVRVPITLERGEAISQSEAVTKAVERFTKRPEHHPRYFPIEYADEVTAVLIDEVGDEEHQRSRSYTEDGDLELGQSPLD